MNEWLLFVGFIVLSLVALIIALYPLRKSKKAVIVCGSLIILFLGGAYWRWGAFPAWSKYRVARVQQARVQAMLKTVGGTDDLIIKLKTTLQQNPQSARGWYLLGRLYASQNQLQKARDAFAKAHHLKPNQAYITVNYVHILWQLNHQQFDDRSRSLLRQVLNKNPNQPDALAMLAMDAYEVGEYQQAIDYWQHLLTLAPPQTDDAKAIQKAIAKAQQQLLKASHKRLVSPHE